jgi:uncharacterized surface protein with fasciclin (FAS1) repeats
MLRAKLLAATAVVTLIAAPAFAQEMTPPTSPPTSGPSSTQTPATDSAPMDAAAPTAQGAAPAAAQTAPAATPAAGESVVDVLKSSGQFTTLLSALEAAQLTETLATRPAISIFAPTDAAFAALPEAERTRLMDPANAAELRQLLLYHVIVADVTPAQIEGKRGGVPTAAESQVLLDGTGEMIKADNATVVSAELDASNGAVFPIDQVLNPANSLAAMGDEEAATAAGTAPADDAMPADSAATTTPTATPPVPNTTTGEVPNPAAPPPVSTPDAVDGAAEGDTTPQ